VKVICDAAVLIGLAKIGKLNLLEKLYKKIYIPWGVYNEVVVTGGRRPGAEEIDQAKWVRKIKVKDRTAVDLLVSEFGQGESEVLILGNELKADWLILDDARARTAAISAGYRIIGLAGILLLAKQRNLIEDIKPLFDELVDKNLRLSDKIMQTILEKAGE
jgi:predicted nucleic acid-binding protein